MMLKAFTQMSSRFCFFSLVFTTPEIYDGKSYKTDAAFFVLLKQGYVAKLNDLKRLVTAAVMLLYSECHVTISHSLWSAPIALVTRP
jgi:hypothetical protein